MVWQPEIGELNLRKKLAAQMGGKENVERSHKRGKLVIRERLDKLVDPGSFQEIGGLSGYGTYKDNKLESFQAASPVIGICTLNGRKVVINGDDITIRGHGNVADKGGFSRHLALDWKLPYIHILEAVGGSVKTFETIGRTYIPANPPTYRLEELMQTAPVVALVLGAAAGIPAIWACCSHFNVMVRGISQVFPGGPPVVKTALGYDITKEELGDERTQIYDSGVVDNLAETEEEAFEMTRRFLSYLPQNIWEMAPRKEPVDDPNRREERLLSVIPRKRTRGYNPYNILKDVLDKDSFFEIAPDYGKSRIVGLARANGYPIGVMINNPMFNGGSLTVAGGSKVMRLIQLCDTFHLPMVYFADEPGFMVGLEAQKQGITRAGARVICVTQHSRMPWITFVTRQLYGVAGECHDRGMRGMFKRAAWPSAHWGSMHIEGGTSAAYRREIDNAEDSEAKREEIEARLQVLASPFRTAEAFNIEDVIDPRDTRPMMCEFVEMAQNELKTQLGPTPGLNYLP